MAHESPRLVRLAEALHITGLGRTAFMDRVRSGELPGPVQLTQRSVAWRESELLAWIDSRPRAPLRTGRPSPNPLARTTERAA